ncbi:hypothetical protein LZP46_04755 [Acinetobacter sp. SCLZS86]|uniref:hypothetical protein n=1 Tax=Acinetobacter sp. SCLZS86 TaxID=2908637 RepID=UPI001F189C4E|nr:hypothetical protein [Acinetobacter sp. SCLZS86]UIZ58416.1 hypothetical protein LZP46_04755 [Acinetobacter sp. SCLZS86]
MQAPWLKSLIFWTILIVVIFSIFQCTQKSESNKTAATLMYERLYQCSRDLNAQQQATLKQIQNQVKAEMTQQEMLELINLCRKTSPPQTREDYIKAIQAL